MHTYFRKADLQNLLVIIILSNLLYFHTLKSPFHLDDFNTIVYRPLIKNIGAFIDNSNEYYHRDNVMAIFHNRDFLLFSFALNYKINGLDVFGYHLVNIFLNTFISILIYFLAKELVERQSFNGSQYHRVARATPEWSYRSETANKTLLKKHSFASLWNKTDQEYSKTIPLLASLLFVVHPIQTEAVTYISSRSSLAVTLFFLGSLLFFMKGTTAFFSSTKGIIHTSYIFICFLGGVLFFILGAGFKESIITLPLIYLVYILLFHFQRLCLFRKTLFAGSFLLVFLLLHFSGFLIYSEEISEITKLNQTEEYQKKSLQESVSKLKEIKKNQHPLLYFVYFFYNKPNTLTEIYNAIYSRAGTVFMIGKKSYSPDIYFLSELEVVSLYYLKLLFFPFNQSVFPDFPPFNSKHWKTLSGSLMILALISIYCLSSNRRLLSFSFFWYVITLMPHTSFIPLTDLASEHRTYLSNVGFVISVATILSSLSFSKRKLFFLSFIMIVLVLASILTLKRNSVWQSEISLWEDTVQKSPRHVKSINALGHAYTVKGKKDKAQSVLQKGLYIDPLNDQLHINIGIIFSDKGNLDKAEEHFRLAILVSNDYKAHINLGKVFLKKELYNKSLEAFKNALHVKPDSFLVQFYLGNVYSRLEEFQKALQHLEKSIELNPDFEEPYNNLGYIYWNLEKHDQAYEWFVKAMNKNPDFPEPYINIGNYFLIKGDREKAERFYKRYRELKNEKNQKS